MTVQLDRTQRTANGDESKKRSLADSYRIVDGCSMTLVGSPQFDNDRTVK